ncbi:MAG: ATP-dependent zinc metalloprotease FtsH [Candidatus Eisenbacteria sp.]|nr:ATP-dependent zinc metalloprotease FtsH [Candidatus Eisenbacteria bacterium]
MVLLALFAFQLYSGRNHDEREVSYTWFRDQVEASNIRKVTVDEREIRGELLQPAPINLDGTTVQTTKFRLWIPAPDPELPDKIYEKNPKAEVRGKPAGTNWITALISWIPLIVFLGIWIFFMRQMQSGGNRAFSFGKSRARLLTGNQPRVTFDDVAGATEAKEELGEIIDFLKDPRKFQRLGGKIPKGALLLGAPGTGKTLLARAVAGEADVPFFSMSGSDFVEMFVGVGASRVRDLFEQGKKSAPCIIFIDELDAVGRHRGAGLGGGHDEREQTLNQLLVEMDGFESNEGVILVAATNRPDVLDPALLRPGRFDRQIVVDMPDAKGREGILRVHSRKIPLGKKVDLEILARGTPGFSGADLANMVNEAALLAARRDRTRVTMQELEDAKDKVMMGPERRSLILTDEERKGIAYHEAGHALVAVRLPSADPLHKVTIIPRGQSLGSTLQIPEKDKYKLSKQYCLDRIAVLLAGRVADILVGEEPTTGASDDIEKASKLARRMVCEWGMSEHLGPISYAQKEEQIFLGREISQHRDYSEKTAVAIDEEVRAIINACEEQARGILSSEIDTLHRLAAVLLEREVLDRKEIEAVLEGRELPPVRARREPRKHVSKADAKFSDEADTEEAPPPEPPEKASS